MSALVTMKPQTAPKPDKHIMVQGASFTTMTECYQAMEHNLESIARQFEECGGEAAEDPHLDVQSDIMDMASNTRASTFDDLYLKMMLWYWDAPDLDDLSSVSRSDRVLLSVLKDLSRLSGQPDDKSR